MNSIIVTKFAFYIYTYTNRGMVFNEKWTFDIQQVMVLNLCIECQRVSKWHLGILQCYMCKYEVNINLIVEDVTPSKPNTSNMCHTCACIPYWYSRLIYIYVQHCYLPLLLDVTMERSGDLIPTMYQCLCVVSSKPREAKPRGASIYLWSTQMIKSSKSMVVQFGISSSSRNALLGVHSERQSWPLPKHKPNVDHSLVCLVNHNLHNLSGLSLLSWCEPPLTGWFENIYLHLQLL